MLFMMVRCRRGQYGSPRTRLAMAALRWPRHWPRNGLARGLSRRISSSFGRATPHSFPRSRHEKQSVYWTGPRRKAWNMDHNETLPITDALAFGLEPDSFVRPGTASMRSLRRAQFFPPARRLRSPRRVGDVARPRLLLGIEFEAATLIFLF